ncbi:MAG: uracil-DNA glycosylase [Flavobacteriales bacterium]|nr:uracil-DNA glycosylase [Flavobacteriales bacterium]MDP7430353.1 uracil-DNA glycosylase [Flavobacteriales bacterium]HJN63339.1 uracil-DNA glycosylase [Flavobacteriales bacterium]
MNPNIEQSWKVVLLEEFNKDYFIKLKQFLLDEKKHHSIYPKGKDIFNAFHYTPFDRVKVVILGQDPYHGIGQAHGLSFSVPNGVKQPPSLKNIFKEIAADLNLPLPVTGNLSPWAKQGVLLLNATLSVRVKQAGSHQKKGWEEFTNSVIQNISQKKEGVIFLLWGSFAQDKAELIDKNKHHILTAPHPSPFSAYRGFFGCNHFSKTNKLLVDQGLKEIDWKI